MIQASIVYGLLIGALLGVGALGADGACRLAGRPTRWIWAGVLLLTVGLTALAPHRGSPRSIPGAIRGMVWTDAPTPRDEAGAYDRLRSRLEAATAAITRPVWDALGAIERGIPARLERWIAALWLTVSGLLLLGCSAVYLRVRRACRSWPSATLLGVRVRVAPDMGPVVIGLIRPEIVVPRWLLERGTEEQRLVLAHEQEHLRTRDPLVLAAGCLVVTLLPWHPVIWWMLARLRLSVELDCDGRVLRQGVERRSYGALLIDLAGHCAGGSPGLPIGIPALADRSSHLERRLLAMTPQRSRFTYARGGALTAVALLSVLAACEARLPTSPEIDRMDVAAAEQSAVRAARGSLFDSTATYTIDGVAASAEQAHALPASQIASIEMLRHGGGAPAEVRIRTRSTAGDHAAAAPTQVTVRVLGVHAAALSDSARTIAASASRQRFAGLVFIDGVRVDPDAFFGRLRPDDIKSIEVIKGPRAAALYTDPAAANGVILVTTRRGSATK